MLIATTENDAGKVELVVNSPQAASVDAQACNLGVIAPQNDKLSNLAIGVSAKLSKLQKRILLLALANVEKYGPQQYGADLCNAEILVTIYGFILSSKLPRWYRADVLSAIFHDPRIGCGQGQLFEPDRIGRKRYNTAHVAISRALTRLSERGLIFVNRGLRHPGCNLTPMGIEIAKRLKETQRVDINRFHAHDPVTVKTHHNGDS